MTGCRGGVRSVQNFPRSERCRYSTTTRFRLNHLPTTIPCRTRGPVRMKSRYLIPIQLPKTGNEAPSAACICSLTACSIIHIGVRSHARLCDSRQRCRQHFQLLLSRYHHRRKAAGTDGRFQAAQCSKFIFTRVKTSHRGLPQEKQVHVPRPMEAAFVPWMKATGFPANGPVPGAARTLRADMMIFTIGGSATMPLAVVTPLSKKPIRRTVTDLHICFDKLQWL